MNEEEQPGDTRNRKQQGTHYGEDGCKGVRQCASRGKSRHAVQESAEEDSQCPLSDSVLHKADDDAR